MRAACAASGRSCSPTSRPARAWTPWSASWRKKAFSADKHENPGALAPGFSLAAYNGTARGTSTTREPLRCVADAAGRGDGVAVVHLQVAGELRAFLDLDLGVADLARHASRGVYGELLA